MAVTTTGSFAKALWPGVNTWYQQRYNDWDEEWKDLFEQGKSDKTYEEDVGIMGFGLAQKKTEGKGIAYDNTEQGFISRYNNVVYGLGFQVTREMYEDDQYNVIESRSKALAFSMRTTKENVAANVYNRAFNSSYTGGDGVEMCSAAHLLKNGGTFRNELATAADLSESAVEQAIIDIGKLKDERGLQVAIKPECLIIPVELEFEAERILGSTLQNDSANNAINALKSRKSIPKGYKMNHYLSDADAWFILTNCPEGVKMFQRRAQELQMDNDFDTENAKYKSTERYSFGWTDPRGIFGSPGA
jgi:hypothetical protein